ncbi:hypothetical protein [Leptothermofonsia sp. ETS-13]|uniref:hypothetical protein n=1 Tax=Leptothermofonsia sp. ETS-13 TaxID=3035696 RepID=UPI003B9FC129
MTQDQPSSDLPNHELQGMPEPSPDAPERATEEVGETPPVPLEQTVKDSKHLSERTEPSFSHNLQDYWDQTRPLLKAQTIKALKAMIHILEKVVEKLEKPEPEPLSVSDSGITPDESSAPILSNGLWEKIRSAWLQFQDFWKQLLVWVRALLPEVWNEKLSDRGLTGAIAGVLILLLWVTSGLFSSKPKPITVAVSPAPKETNSSPQVSVPPVKPTAAPKIKGSEPAQPSAPKSTEEKPVTQKPFTPMSPTPVAKPAPPPLKLTPEQKLIARIQDQVAEVSNQYVNGLIQAVQANFRSSRLIVKVGPGWYGLSLVQQNKLADEMLGRARQLNFSKLEITDSEGILLARSPVIGSEMLILKRENSSPEAA